MCAPGIVFLPLGVFTLAGARVKLNSVRAAGFLSVGLVGFWLAAFVLFVSMEASRVLQGTESRTLRGFWEAQQPQAGEGACIWGPWWGCILTFSFGMYVGNTCPHVCLAYIDNSRHPERTVDARGSVWWRVLAQGFCVALGE